MDVPVLPLERYRTGPAVVRRNLRLLLLSVAVTVVGLRLSLHLRPDADLDVAGYNVHHLFTGLLLVVAGGIPLALFRGSTRRLDLCLLLFGAGLGMALDEWVYLIATDGSNASYLLPVSLWGAVAVVGAACLYALALAGARLTAAAVLAACVAGPLQAQAVQGRVLEREGRSPVAGAAVELRGGAGEVVASTLADSAGVFVLRAPAAGSFRLAAERIGFARAETLDFALEPRLTLEVELLLGTEPIPLEPLVVTRRIRASRQLADFHARAAESRRSGSGRFLTRADLDREASASIATVLDRIPEVRVIDVVETPTSVPTMELRMRMRGMYCRPLLYVDGAALPLDGLDPRMLRDPEELEGIEVYRTPLEAPVQYQDPEGCGTILLWTRADRAPGRRGWWRHAIGSAILAGFLATLALR